MSTLVFKNTVSRKGGTPDLGGCKLQIMIAGEEGEESMCWLELLTEARIFEDAKIALLGKAAGESTAIFTEAGKTTKKRK